MTTARDSARLSGAAWYAEHIRLTIDVPADPAAEGVRVVAETRVSSLLGPTDDLPPLELDGRALTTHEVAVDGRVLTDSEYESGPRSLRIPDFPRTGVVRTVVTAPVGGAGDKGFAWRPGLLSTNCEPRGFRRITWSLDHPANRSTFEVEVVADPGLLRTVLVNGDLVSHVPTTDGRVTTTFVDDVPKPTYLFALVAGDLDVRSVDLRGTGADGDGTDGHALEQLVLAAPPDLIAGTDFALAIVPRIIAFDRATGGLPHPHRTLTFVALPGYPDATEYQSLMFFDPAVLVADPTGHVDDDLMLVILNTAHEYGHHTRGNRVTVRSWGQLALKEGLTVLTAQNDTRRHLLGPAARILDVLDLRRLQFPEEVTIGAPVVRGEVDDPEALYTRTTYLKGAEVFGMLRTILGDAGWRQVTTSFWERYDLGSASVDDFVEHAAARVPSAAGSLRSTARWFGLAGRPSLRIDSRHEAGSLVADVRRTDSLRDEPCVGIPVAVAAVGPTGPVESIGPDGVARLEHVVVVDARQATIVLTPVAGSTLDGTVLSSLRGFSAPVDLDVSLTEGDLALVVRHDTDPVGRWWAAQELGIRAVDAHRSGGDAAAITHVLAEALGGALDDGIDDPLLVALLLTLPDEFMLGDREPMIDVDGVAAGLGVLRTGLGVALHDRLLGLLRTHTDDPSGREPADIAARWLVEPVLALLLATGSPEAVAVALAEYRGPNPTRAIRALTQLAHLDDDVLPVSYDELLAEGWTRWQASPKIIDRWLRAQSGSRRPDTVRRVAELASGPLYDPSDRGRVMAVWFPFATRNRVAFHDPSGEGYRIFVDEVIALMPTNAGLVVRLVGDLLQFTRFDGPRQALLRRELERMATAPGMPDFAVAIVNGLLTKDQGS